MNRHVRMLSVCAGRLYSSFDLSKGFLHIPIPAMDQKYFGVFLWVQFYVFTRFLFGFVNSKHSSNSGLSRTMLEI